MVREEKDLEKVVHQLRELLVAKEEELESLTRQIREKGGTVRKAPPSGDSAKELEGYKKTIASLEESIEELKKESEETDAELQEELSKRDETIASLNEQLQKEPAVAAGTAKGARLKDALEKIGRLEEELAQSRAEAAGASEEEGDSEDLLTPLQEKLDRTASHLLMTKEKYHDLNRRYTWFKIGSIVLGIFLCISVLINLRQRSTPPGTDEKMGFITAAEDDLFEIEVARPPGAEEALSLVTGPKTGVAELSDETHIEYTVKRGDNLWKICKRELGNASLADLVAHENNLAIPRALEVGQILYLPKPAEK